MGFCSCTIKFLMLIFNLICAIAGLIILVVGILVNTNSGNFKTLISGQVTSTSIAIMIFGAIVFLIAFFGCCGAMREDTCMINTYAVILLVILIAEIIIGVVAFVYKGKVKDAINDTGRKIFNSYDKKANKDIVDEIQKDLECCGFDGPSDYKNNNMTIPTSCCAKDQKPCKVFTKGCAKKITKQIQDGLQIIGAVAIVIGVVELLGVVCAFYLASTIRNHKRRGYA